MKKFLVYLGVIIATVALGFTVMMLVRNDEVISISATSMYVCQGDVFNIDVNYDNKKLYTDVDVIITSSSETDPILQVPTSSGYQFRAVAGGMATITFRTNNANYRNLACSVFVGDGSEDNPFYISTSQQFAQIGVGALNEQGKPDPTTMLYPLDAHYRLINNIDLKYGSENTGYWVPIGVQQDGSVLPFTGVFDGNNHTISTVHINMPEYNNEAQKLGLSSVGNDVVDLGLFAEIGQGARVMGVNINNMTISHDDTIESAEPGKVYEHIGTIAGVNKGTVERCAITNTTIRANAKNIGGVVGYNVTTNNDMNGQEAYQRFVARVDRCSAVVNYGGRQIVFDGEVQQAQTTYVGAGATDTAYVGGVVGYNHGGRVIYSYSMGDAYLNGTIVYGGIVGLNEEAKDLGNASSGSVNEYKYTYEGGHVKDCYTLINLYIPSITAQTTSATPVEAEDGPVGAAEDPVVYKSGSVIGGIIGINRTDTLKVYSKNGVLMSSNEGLDDAEETVITVNKVVGNYYRINDPEAPVESTVFIMENGGNTTFSQDNIKGIGFQGSTGSEAIIADANSLVLVAEGKTDTEMRKVDTYLSHKEVGADAPIPWKFNICWIISIYSNNGYPELIYSLISITDDLDDVYDGQINSYEQLAKIKLNQSYVISGNLTADSFAEYIDNPDGDADRTGWVPLGTEENPFTGTIMALTDPTTSKPYVIEGFYISKAELGDKVVDGETIHNADIRTNIKYSGLFGVIGKSGVIRNLYIKKATSIHNYETTDSGAGIIAGRCDGTIENCTVEDSQVMGVGNVGGIAGIINDGGRIINTTFSTNLAATERTIASVEANGPRTDVSVGGIVGRIYSGCTVSGCEVLGGIEVKVRASARERVANSYMGGIAGQSAGTIVRCFIYNSAGQGIVGEYVDGAMGGIVGRMTGSALVDQCLANTVVEGDTRGTYTEKIVEGQTDTGTDIVRSETYTAKNYVGGIVGEMMNRSIVSNSAYYGSGNASAINGDTVGGIVGYLHVDDPGLSYSKRSASGMFDWDTSQGTRPERASLPDNAYVAVETSFVKNAFIKGYTAGGLAGIISTGAMHNVYINASGDNGCVTTLGNIGAGLAGELQNKSSAIFKAYASVRLVKDNGSGKLYGDTSSPIRSSKDSTGYIVDYILDSDAFGGDVTRNKNGWNFIEDMGTWFKDDLVPETGSGNLKSGSANKFVSACGFDGQVWSWESGKYGYLRIETQDLTKEITDSDGNVVVTSQSSIKDFIERLAA